MRTSDIRANAARPARPISVALLVFVGCVCLCVRFVFEGILLGVVKGHL